MGLSQRRRRTNDQMIRDARALDLRRRNKSYREIADALGWGSPSRAYEAVQRALMDAIVEDAEAIRAVELERLDDLARTAWQILNDRHLHVTARGNVALHPETGKPLIDDGPTLQAIDRLLKIGESRRKLLGIDAPTKVQVLTTDVIDAEIAALTRRLGANDDAGNVPA